MLPYDSKCVHIMLSSKGMKILYCESQWLSIIHSIAMHLKLKNSVGFTISKIHDNYLDPCNNSPKSPNCTFCDFKAMCA